MNTFNNMNNTLNTATDTITKINVARIANVRDIITLCIEFSNEHKAEFSTKRNANAKFIEAILGDDSKTANAYFKRSVVIAKHILVDGYKIKMELLTLAQMEQLTAFNKNKVNALMSLSGDDYVASVKGLIITAKVAKSTKVFSRATAKKA